MRVNIDSNHELVDLEILNRIQDYIERNKDIKQNSDSIKICLIDLTNVENLTTLEISVILIISDKLKDYNIETEIINPSIYNRKLMEIILESTTNNNLKFSGSPGLR